MPKYVWKLSVYTQNIREYEAGESGANFTSVQKYDFHARSNIRMGVILGTSKFSYPPTGFPQKSQKKVPWFFHDFSRPKSKFPDKKNQYLFLRPMCQFVESITDRQRRTLTHRHTHDLIKAKPATIQLILLVIELINKSKLHLLISLKWVTDFPIIIWKMISISHFHTDFTFNIIIIIFQC